MISSSGKRCASANAPAMCQNHCLSFLMNCSAAQMSKMHTEATVAVTHAFARKKTSIFIISSHIVEAGDQLRQMSNIGFMYLPTRMNGHTPQYTYKLETGITDDRHGMIIIRNEGILDTLRNGRRQYSHSLISSQKTHTNMGFGADRQTTDELNLLGKFKSGSVYNLFCQVKTRGGERLLDEIFQNPLTDPMLINKRSSIFKFFQDARLSFPFDAQQISVMREYLDARPGGNAAMVFANTVTKKWLSGLTRDERYKNGAGLTGYGGYPESLLCFCNRN